MIFVCSRRRRHTSCALVTGVQTCALPILEEGGWDLSKVDKEKLLESKATLVFGQMNEPPGARARVALSGLTVAEYFRDGDEESGGRDVLFFIDNIFRFTQEIGRAHV